MGAIRPTPVSKELFRFPQLDEDELRLNTREGAAMMNNESVKHLVLAPLLLKQKHTSKVLLLTLL